MKLFFFDTETTGLNSDDQVLQFGGIFGTFDGENFHEERKINQFINVTKEISPNAERVHGISKDKVKNFGYIEDYIDEILLYIKKADYIIGHNLDFDIKMLKQECNRIGQDFARDNIKSFCTMKETIDILNLPGKKRPKLSELYHYLFNKTFNNAHDAMADIEATKDCFIELVKRNKIKDFKENIGDNLQMSKKEELGNALIIAATDGNKEIVEALIKSGIDINMEVSDGFEGVEIPLVKAIVNGHKDIVEMLIKAGADVEAIEYSVVCGYFADKPITAAIKKGYKDIIEILIKAGADVNFNYERGTPLIMAAFGNKDIIEMLIKAGADVNVQNNEGNTALIQVSSNGNKDIVDILIKAGADVNIQNNEGNTALIKASSNGHKEIVKLLLEAGANVNIYNYEGETALIIAKNLTIEELLEKHGALI